MHSYQRMLFVQVGRLTILISDITKTQDGPADQLIQFLA